MINKKLVLLIILIILPLVHARSYGSGVYGSGLYGTRDVDKDGIEDNLDNLLYNGTEVTTSGITALNVTVGGEKANGSFNGNKRVLFYDQEDIIINFTHNFSQSNVLDLSKVNIQRTSNYLIVNFSGQLKMNKTLYIDDNSFVNLCVKDSEISSIDEMSSGCNGNNETDFTSCLGKSNVTLNGITCKDGGSRIIVENLQYSAIRGTQATATPTDLLPLEGGGIRNPATSYCILDSDCNETQYCFNNVCYDAECMNDSDCNIEEEICFNHRCVKLFDIEIKDFESPATLGDFFDFTYFIKGMAEINGDVEIRFWIEKEGEMVTWGQDTIYLGAFEEKTKTTKLYLPKNTQTGIYTFNIEVSYGKYAAKSYRTIEVIVGGELASISIFSNKSYIYITSVLIGISLFLLCLIFYLEQKKIKGQIKEERLVKKHRFTFLALIFLIVLGILFYFLRIYELIWIGIVKTSLFIASHYILSIGLLIVLIILILLLVYRKKILKKFRDFLSKDQRKLKSSSKVEPNLEFYVSKKEKPEETNIEEEINKELKETEEIEKARLESLEKRKREKLESEDLIKDLKKHDLNFY